MAIQNEAVDEDLEHFEDVPDEAEDDLASDEMPQNNEDDIDTVLNSDSDSSQDEEASSASSEEEDNLDEDDDDLFGRKNAKEPLEFNSVKVSDQKEDQLPESLTKHSLPGGYDPQHREPSFWYTFCYLLL